MQFLKKARTGLLLILTAGPFLVFLFLYLFGKNQFELDTYPFSFKKAQFQSEANCYLLTDFGYPIDFRKEKQFENQLKRLQPFFEEFSEKPFFVGFESKISIEAVKSNAKTLGISQWILPNPGLLEMAEKDSVLSINTAKGPSEKRLPEPPRSFLFDKKGNLRGVYGLCNGLSVDTLMLEFKILTNQ
jgi:hypothetical protein